MLRQKLEETCTRERDLQQNLNERNVRIAHIDSKVRNRVEMERKKFMIIWIQFLDIFNLKQTKEAMIAMRIKEADSTLEIAEMRRKMSAYETKVIVCFFKVTRNGQKKAE